MVRVLARAVRDRQRPLRAVVEVPYDRFVLRLTPAASAEIVASARRRVGPHNVRRRYVEALLWQHLHTSTRGTGPVGARGHVRRRLAIRFGPGRAGRGSQADVGIPIREQLTAADWAMDCAANPRWPRRSSGVASC